ncbi:hypothetical protein ACLOJK_026242 [Asimina triloba]
MGSYKSRKRCGSSCPRPSTARSMGSGQEDDETTHPMIPLRSPHGSSSSADDPDHDQLCSSSSSSSAAVVRLTIWCKSQLFNCNGYTVFDDSSGKMVFRVDDYACNRRDETFLMDFAGNVLLTIRRCKKVCITYGTSTTA